MFRINLRGVILFKALMSCAGSQCAVSIAVCLVCVGPAPVAWGEPTPFISPTGESSGDFFGHSVSGAGDMNNDGFDDVIVGAILAGGTGRAYLYFGGTTADETADLTLIGQAGGDNFGYPVSDAGDVNADGFDDVIVGAHTNDAGGTNAGRAYVYFGGSEPDAIPDLILTGESPEDFFGFAVSAAGDVNGDGFDDMIVGAGYNDSGSTNGGRAYVYCGGPFLDDTADLLLNGQGEGDYFGHTVSRAGDVNGDGFNDMTIGALSNDPADFEIGRAYVYYGGPEWDSLADLTLTGQAPNDLFSFSVSGGADVNGDGFDEVIVGALYGNRVEVHNGGPDTEETPTADLILTGEFPGDSFGNSVSEAGDVNGDGYGDMIVGAVGNDSAGDYAGRAYVFFGGSSPNETADLTFTGEFLLDTFGISVSGAEDFNGDGYDDVIVGASRNNFAGEDAGRAYVYLGGSRSTGVDIVSPATGHVLLSPPAPNPLVGSGMGHLQFKLNFASPVRLFLQDVQGRTVADRERESFAGGAHSVLWNPGELPSGVYYLRIEAGGDIASTRWVIVR